MHCNVECWSKYIIINGLLIYWITVQPPIVSGISFWYCSFLILFNQQVQKLTIMHVSKFAPYVLVTVPGNKYCYESGHLYPNNYWRTWMFHQCSAPKFWKWAQTAEPAEMNDSGLEYCLTPFNITFKHHTWDFCVGAGTDESWWVWRCSSKGGGSSGLSLPSPSLSATSAVYSQLVYTIHFFLPSISVQAPPTY